MDYDPQSQAEDRAKLHASPRAASTFYRIWFTYYRYNSGNADNGNYTRKVDFNTLEEAVAAKWQILAYINKALPEYQRDELEEEFLGGRCEGFFKSFDSMEKIVTVTEPIA